MNQDRWFIDKVLNYSAHTDVRIEKYDLDRNFLQPYKSILADLDGQKGNYRITLDDGKDIHIKEYDDCYLIHWDHANPSKDPIKHLLNDSPHWIPGIVAGIVVTAIITAYAVHKYK